MLENLFDLVGKGMGVALLMKQWALYIQDAGVAIADVSPGVSSQINLGYPRGVELSDAAKHFVGAGEQAQCHLPDKARCRDRQEMRVIRPSPNQSCAWL